MKTKEEIEKAAMDYVKTLAAINYSSAYNFGMQNITAFIKGAEFTNQQLKELNERVMELEEVNKNYGTHLNSAIDLIKQLTAEKAELLEGVEKTWSEACNKTLDEISKAFLSNLDKASDSDKDIFKTIGETIKKFPIPPFIKPNT